MLIDIPNKNRNNRKRRTIFNNISKRNNVLKNIGKSYVILTMVLFFTTCITSYMVDVIKSNAVEIENSYALLLSISETKNVISFMETSARGYALYYDNSFFKDYKRSKQKFKNDINNAIKYSSSDKTQLKRMIKIRDITNKWISSADKTIEKISSDKSKNISLLKNSGPPRTKVMNEVMYYSEATIHDEKEKIRHNLIQNNNRKIVINVILALISFTTIWMVLTQAQNITRATKVISKTSESLANEIDIREDLEASFQEIINIYTSLLNASMDAIVIANHEGNIIEASNSCYIVFGYMPHELVGNNIADMIVPPHLREAHLKGMKRYLEKGEKVIMNRRVKTEGLKRDGTCFPLELTLVEIRSEESPLFAAFMRNL